MYRKPNITSSLIDNISIKGKGYRVLQHLACNRDIKPFTWIKDPEFLFSLGAIVGLGALIIFRCIIHRSSIQANTDYQFLKHQTPIIGHPEWIVLSNVLVNRYGMDRYLKYKTLKTLKELNFIELHPDIKKEKAPVVKIAAGVLDYLNILRDEDLRNSLNDRVKRLRKLQNETGGTNAKES